MPFLCDMEAKSENIPNNNIYILILSIDGATMQQLFNKSYSFVEPTFVTDLNVVDMSEKTEAICCCLVFDLISIKDCVKTSCATWKLSIHPEHQISKQNTLKQHLYELQLSQHN